MDGFGANVHAHQVFGEVLGVHQHRRGVGGEFLGGQVIQGQQKVHSHLGCLVQHLPGVVHVVSVQQRGADGAALGGQKGVGHAAADENGVCLLKQIFDDADLVGHLGPAQDGHQGALGGFQGSAHELELLLHQQAGHRGQIVGHPFCGGVGPVGGPARVEAKQISQRGQFPGEIGVVLLLLHAETEVLYQYHLTRLESGALFLGVWSQHVLGQRDGNAQQLLQVVPGGEQGELLFPLAVGAAHVGEKNDRGIVLQQIADGGQCGHDAGVIVNDPGGFVVGNVEITAQEDLFPGYINVPDGLLVIIHQKKAPSFHFCRRVVRVPLRSGGGSAVSGQNPAREDGAAFRSPSPHSWGKPSWRSAS